MTASLVGRRAVPVVALVVGCLIAIVVGVTQLWREPAPETSGAPAASTTSQPASGARIENAPTLASSSSQEAAATVAPAVSSGAPIIDKPAPSFDIASIEPTGDAVIAGRAAPGATVDLLRNGERLERVIADSSGQFVMAPLHLPPGSYELTLSARSPDGTLAVSKGGVAIALADAAANSGVARSRAEMPLNAPKAVMAQAPSQGSAGRPSRMNPPSQPSLRAAKLQDDAASQLPHTFAAASPAHEGSSSPAVARGTTTRVVSRGDSLWRISRVTYGEGTQYVVVYKANRERIRNPDLIYPGQIIVLPTKTN